jgi:hypothetical protein
VGLGLGVGPLAVLLLELGVRGSDYWPACSGYDSLAWFAPGAAVAAVVGYCTVGYH